MALLAYNLTGSPVVLAAGNSPIPTLPASASPPNRGERVNVTTELKGLSGPDYASIQVQVDASDIEIEWTVMEEYPTPGLTPSDSFAGGGAAAALATTGADVDVAAASAPETGAVLRATSGTAASWDQTVSAADALTHATGQVSASGATAPTAGQILIADGASTAVWTNIPEASVLDSASEGAGVTVNSSTPESGDVLKATSGTAATWQGTVHALGSSEHTSDTLANLNNKVSDATLIDTADSRLSDSRAPSGEAGGSLADSYPNPSIAALAVSTDELAGSGVTPAKLSSEVTSMWPLMVIRESFAPGAGGSADDVSIYSGDAPFGFQVLDVVLLVSTAVAAHTVTLRDATAGGGAELSDVFDAATVGTKRNTILDATLGIAGSGTLQIRRSDSGIGGEIIITILKS